LADCVAAIAGTKVIYDIPDEKEAAGYSKATKALLDTSKIESLGWHSRYSVKEGIRRTLEMQGYYLGE
jgi:nucleoside-diphosphate-sugar epimerase